MLETVGHPTQAEHFLLAAQNAQTTPHWKVCSHCRYPKPLELFYNKARGKFGKQEQCKRCMMRKPADPEILSWEQLHLRYPEIPSGGKTREKNLGGHVRTTAESDTDTQVPTSRVFEEEQEQQNGQEAVNFVYWLRNMPESVVFATDRVCIVRRPIQGNTAYAIYRNTNRTIYLPSSYITETDMCEFIVRAVYNNIEGESTITGHAYL